MKCSVSKHSEIYPKSSETINTMCGGDAAEAVTPQTTITNTSRSCPIRTKKRPDVKMDQQTVSHRANKSILI